MARFKSLLQSIIQKKLDAGMTRDDAFDTVRHKNHEAIAKWYDHIESIKARFDGLPPPEWQGIIGKVKEAIALERELLNDLDDLEASSWARER